MRKFSAFFLLLSFIASVVFSAQGQSRPRRVSQDAPPGNPSITAPARPPVLGGQTQSTGTQTTERSTSKTDEIEEVDAGDVIRVETTLITLPVSVMDRDGRYIPNLRKENFRIWEDGVEQNVAFFSSVDKPFSVVLMIDTSGSTRFKLEDIQAAAITFVNQLRNDDKVMVVSFDSSVRVLSDFTSDRRTLHDAIRRTSPGDATRLYDAMDLVMNQQLNRISGRKAIVLFTDGVDTTSRRADYDSNVRDAEELDALVFPVQYDTFRDVNSGGGPSWPGRRGPRSSVDILIDILGGMGGGRGPVRGGGIPGSSRRDYERANRYLQDLAQKTGARHFEADSLQNVSQAFANVAEELRRQYSLGYYPKRPPERGQRRQIRVRVDQPNLAVRARDSYVFNPSTAGGESAAQKDAPVLQRRLNNNE